MTVRSQGARITVAALLAAALAAGCGSYRVYKGKPEGFATRAYTVAHPMGFVSGEIPQASPEMIILISFAQDIPVSPNAPEAPAMILVRAHRMRADDTVRTFLERLYDSLAARYLGVTITKVAERGDQQEWSVAVEGGGYDQRLIVLPKEKLAYDVLTACPPQTRKQLDEVLAHVRASLRVRPAAR